VRIEIMTTSGAVTARDTVGTPLAAAKMRVQGGEPG
jgi:hypothetical protein